MTAWIPCARPRAPTSCSLPSRESRGVHVVGGAVRDALRGQVPRELDLVVEGDALPVAARAAERVGGELTVHERFGTATITADGFAFDLAGARRETLRAAGRAARRRARRDVEEDLARRDFTVNAIAVSLADGAITRVAGRPRGPRRAACCASCTTRSFVDDPTRMLRLVRYAARLDFAPDPATRGADRPGAVRHRHAATALGNELRLLLNEPRVALALLERYGLGRALLGEGFRVDLARRARRHRRRSRSPRAARRSRVKRSPPASTTSGSGGRTGMSWWPRRTASSAFTVTWTVSDAELWRLLRRERVETVQLLAAAGDEGAQRWLDRDPPPQALDLRRRPDRRGPHRAAVGEGLQPRDGRDARRPRAGPRVAAGARPYPLTLEPARALPLGERPDRRRPAARAGRLLDRARRRVEGPFASLNLGLLTDDAPRERRREPAPAGGDRRPSVAALLLRAPGARHDRPAGHRAAVRAAARTRRRTARRPR